MASEKESSSERAIALQKVLDLEREERASRLELGLKLDESEQQKRKEWRIRVLEAELEEKQRREKCEEDETYQDMFER